MSGMGRRGFISLLGGAATAWPLAARAQQPVPVIGFCSGTKPGHDSERQNWALRCRQALDPLMTASASSRFSGSCAASPRACRLISAGVMVAAKVIRTVPIVFVLVPDPVGAGFVDSLGRPGGNVTGFTPYEYGISAKWLELLKEISRRPAREKKRGGGGRFGGRVVVERAGA
jgi:putative tryptophan/tyrosine transport system substrate-binding protein